MLAVTGGDRSIVGVMTNRQETEVTATVEACGAHVHLHSATCTRIYIGDTPRCARCTACMDSWSRSQRIILSNAADRPAGSAPSRFARKDSMSHDELRAQNKEHQNVIAALC